MHVGGMLAPPFLAGFCLAKAVLLVSQIMHMSIPVVPICNLLSQALGMTIFSKKLAKSSGWGQTCVECLGVS